jgi:hypothetical protein
MVHMSRNKLPQTANSNCWKQRCSGPEDGTHEAKRVTLNSKLHMLGIALCSGPEDGTHEPKHAALTGNSTCWEQRCSGPEDGTHEPKQAALKGNSTCWEQRCVERNIICIVYSDLRGGGYAVG